MAHLRRRSVVELTINGHHHARSSDLAALEPLIPPTPIRPLRALRTQPRWRSPLLLTPLLLLLLLFGTLIWQTSMSVSGVVRLKDTTRQQLISMLQAGQEPLQKEDYLAYRRHLEQKHAPYNRTGDRALGFDSIYVLSLPSAAERQDQMQKIAWALGLQFEIFQATTKDLPAIGWIADRVKEIKDIKRPVLAKVLGKAEGEVGGMGADSVWFQDERPEQGFVFGARNDSRWTLDETEVAWTEYLVRAPAASLQSQTTEAQVKDLLWDRVETGDFRQLTAAVLACWHSHTSMWRKMLAKGESSALFLEDDVDIEWDIDRLWPNAHRVLPDDWDMVFLGHCWGRTRSQPMYLNPIVRRAAEPRCLHAYALSGKGAAKLLSLVDLPWVAYQSAIDLVVPKIIKDGQINGFVLEPPLINQAKKAPSSIQTGTGNAWKGLLMDSTLDRIWRDEGLHVPQPTWDETKEDPAIWNS